MSAAPWKKCANCGLAAPDVRGLVPVCPDSSRCERVKALVAAGRSPQEELFPSAAEVALVMEAFGLGTASRIAEAAPGMDLSFKERFVGFVKESPTQEEHDASVGPDGSYPV